MSPGAVVSTNNSPIVSRLLLDFSMMKKSLHLEGKNSEKCLSVPAPPPPLSCHMVVAGIMGEAKIVPWSPIELAVLFLMLGYIKKNNEQTQEPLGHPLERVESLIWAKNG